MSEPKLITPLLADHIMGDPISDHHGVRCCPALMKDTDEKYIVKIISIPAARSQLDAMLLTGACRSEDDALHYFQQQAEAVTGEAELLTKLSNLEGFRAYEAWQIEPMDGEIGFDVYLLGKYSMTLARQLRLGCLTHLAAVNLGLDLCAALSVCRRNGYLYVDLKPENISVTENKEFRISDLGFVSLSSLKYTSLPDKYRSAYTAPEIADAFSSLNTTMDIYAAGLILYQVFNGGELPGADGELTPPAYADYEMSKIILKACAAVPEERWQDPQEMGQALASYLQSTTVNDTPIIPVAEPEPEIPETPADVADPSEPESEDASAVEEPISEVSEEQLSDVEEIVDNSPVSNDDMEDETSDPHNNESLAEDEPQIPEEEDLPKDELEEAEQFVIDGFLFDDSLSDSVPEEDLFSEEVSEMLAQADDLIAHKTPDPVVAPEPVEVPMPEPIPVDPEPEPLPETEQLTLQPEETEADEPESEPVIEDQSKPERFETAPKRKSADRKKLSVIIGTLITVLIILILATGGYYYYQNYYIQSVQGVSAEVFEDRAVITLDTDIDNSLLTVVCTDTYGNSRQQQVENNTAVFDLLNAGTTYKVTLLISGHHKLIGNTTTNFSTATQTNIVSFSAIASDTDGSAILNFSVQGPDSNNWYVFYSTEGEAERSVTCTGHMANITGLTVGSTYTFRLVPESELFIVGNETLEYTALPVIYAENLTIHGYDSGKLMVTWAMPEGVSVDSWTVRCYNTNGFDYTTTVTDTQIAIEGLDYTQDYTVDVKAAGMTVSKWTSITANSITFKDIILNDSVPGQLTISWDYEGTTPADGWKLSCSIAGYESYVIACESNTATIFPVIPGGEYSFGFILPEGVSAFGGTAQYTAPYAEFNSYGISAEDFTFRMCWTPEEENWRWYYLWEQDFTNTYSVGDRASFVIHADGQIEDAVVEIATLFIIRNAEGVPVSVTTGKTLQWATMWNENYTELDMPVMPTASGDYTVDIYFNQNFVTTVSFSITEEAAEE